MTNRNRPLMNARLRKLSTTDYKAWNKEMAQRSLDRMLNAEWTIRYLIKRGWKPLHAIDESRKMIWLWWSKQPDGTEYLNMPYGDTHISLTLERPDRDPKKIIFGAKLHTRSLFCSWVHLEAYSSATSRDTLNNLEHEARRLQTLQNVGI